MRIAYLAEWDARRRDGVYEKICSQTALWREYGNDVKLFIISPIERLTGAAEKGSKHELVLPTTRTGLQIVDKLAKFAPLLRARRAIFAFQPDLLYYRYS